MRRILVALLGTAVLAAPFAVHTQTPQPGSPAIDDAALNTAHARSALEAMIKAMGGDAWLNLKNTEREGHIAGFYKGNPDPGWERIGWDGALDLTAATLRNIADRDGPKAVAVQVASPATTGISGAYGWIQRLKNVFGTPIFEQHGTVRLGAVFCHEQYVRCRQRWSQNRPSHARPRAYWLSDPMGLQPKSYTP